MQLDITRDSPPFEQTKEIMLASRGVTDVSQRVGCANVSMARVGGSNEFVLTCLGKGLWC